MKQTFSGILSRLDLFTHPGSGTCSEDAVGGGWNYLYVIDGATGLDNRPPCMDPLCTDAAWFARETAAWLEHYLPRSPAGLAKILTQGMAHIRSQWKGSEEQMPSAGIAVLRLLRGQLELFALGDCSCSIQKTDGSFVSSEETALRRLDALALAELTDHARRSGQPPSACLPLIQETLRRHRSLRNRPGGYWVLDPSGEGIPHARQQTLPISDCRSLFLCSDGFEQLSGFTGMTLADLHKQTAIQGASALAKQLFAFQDKDRSFQQLPRFKLRDDASAAYGSVTAAGFSVLPCFLSSKRI